MPESRQLDFLEKLAAEKSDAQAVHLAKARAALQQAEDQLAQLQRYEAGYQTQLGVKLGVAMTADALRGHHRFMRNVSVAVHQQELEVARRRANADAIQRVWQDFERRRQGFKVMASKANTLVRRTEERRLQKASDEFAMRRNPEANAGA